MAVFLSLNKQTKKERKKELGKQRVVQTLFVKNTF